MADSEALARYVAATTQDLVDEDYAKGQNRLVPKPPAKGEYIRCSNCGEIMLPENFSKDPEKRRWEFKWHMHWACRNSLLDECDRMTPGLMAERTGDPLSNGRRLPQIRRSSGH